MASTFTRVQGLSELGARMRTLKSDVALKIARAATGSAAAVIKKKAKKNIQTSPSVDTRALLNNVIVKKIPKGESKLTSEHAVTVRGRGRKKRNGDQVAGAPHAHFIEFGTVRAAAEPFLGPAFESEKEHAVQVMKQKLTAGIFKAGA